MEAARLRSPNNRTQWHSATTRVVQLSLLLVELIKIVLPLTQTHYQHDCIYTRLLGSNMVNPLKTSDSHMTSSPHLSSFPFPSWRPFQSRSWCRHHPFHRGSAPTHRAWLIPPPDEGPLDETNSMWLMRSTEEQITTGRIICVKKTDSIQDIVFKWCLAIKIA